MVLKKDIVAKNLIIRVKAEVGEYIGNMKEAGKSFDGTVGKIEQNSAKLQKSGMILAGAGVAVGAAIGGMTAQAMEFNRELGNVETLIPGRLGGFESLALLLPICPLMLVNQLTILQRVVIRLFPLSVILQKPLESLKSLQKPLLLALQQQHKQLIYLAL